MKAAEICGGGFEDVPVVVVLLEGILAIPKGVEEGELFRGMEEASVFVLGVEIDEIRPDFPELSYGSGSAVDKVTGCASGSENFATQDEKVGVVFGIGKETILIKEREELGGVGAAESGFDHGAGGAGPDHIGAGSFS